MLGHMRIASRIDGYTLVEVVVAILIFTVGALALAGGATVIAHAMNADGMRERATRIAASRLELLRAECSRARSGRELVHTVESNWSVARPDSRRIDVIESVTYPGRRGMKTDTYRALAGCR
jgi:prepilin-type N-terminal cleavage/methylation domain-containing protein